jgi:isoleucyl-tRNA synthetase
MADVVLYLPEEEGALTKEDLALLTDMAMVARIDVKSADDLGAEARPTPYLKCDRCWRHTPDVEHGLCARCQQVLSELPR